MITPLTAIFVALATTAYPDPLTGRWKTGAHGHRGVVGSAAGVAEHGELRVAAATGLGGGAGGVGRLARRAYLLGRVGRGDRTVPRGVRPPDRRRCRRCGGRQRRFPGTYLVAFSLVRSADGRVARYDDIVAAARSYGALVSVDAIQGCGWLEFDASAADVVVAGGYKWLMSPRGSAFGYLSPRIRERMTPSAAGWYAGEDVHASYYGPPMRLAAAARRFDISPAWFSYVGTAPALELVERIGVANIGAHDVRLANRFLTGLGRPPGDSAIVTVDVPGAEAKLAAAGVRAAVRAGRVRASFHIYNTDADVDLALNALG
jgi:Aminotransferase class-V